MIQNTQVIIIGAGPAGLAVAACLKQQNIDFIILERSAQVGSSWRSHYHRLHLHTAKGFSNLPDMPFPVDYPRYPSRQQVIDYLDSYARHFHLTPIFNQTVKSISRIDGRWQTQSENTTYTSDFVVMATGLNQMPVIPNFTGQDEFKGQILHSSRYTNGEAYRGQNVLIVGFGNSGAEIALDAYEYGAKVGLSVRSPVNVIFQERFGIPLQLMTIMMNPLPAPIIDMLTTPLVNLTFGNLAPYGLQKPPYGSAHQVRQHLKIPVIDPGIIKKIKAREIKVYPGIERFTSDGVAFTDGTTHPFDVVVLATGFRTNLDALLPPDILSTMPPKSKDGLYFCGYYNAITGLLREIGIEAHQITKDIAAKTIKH